MPTSTTRDEMDDRLARTVVPPMERHAYRELAAARLVDSGLPEPAW